MPEPTGPMTAPTFPDDTAVTYLVTSAQLRRVEVTTNRLFTERKLDGDGMRDLAQYLTVGCQDAVEIDVATEMRKARALDRIHALLDDQHIGSEHIAQVVEELKKAGYEIKDPFHAEEDD